jgi:hypothetical protein
LTVATLKYGLRLISALDLPSPMNSEVFILGRMHEAYDEAGSTDKTIELGLARTGKLVTSAALILMFAFLVLSRAAATTSSPSRSVLRPGSSSTPAHPRPARVGAEAAARPGELVDAELDRVLLIRQREMHPEGTAQNTQPAPPPGQAGRSETKSMKIDPLYEGVGPVW